MDGHVDGIATLAASGVAHRIEADILLGSLNAGEWLRLVDMEARYGASRFEVRSALARLAAVRVLDHVPNRGHRVPLITEAELTRRVEVRLMLELPASGLVLGRATQADRDRLLMLAQRFESAIETASVAALDAANHRFHRAFIALCGNEDLERLINELRERTKPRGWLHWKTVAHSRASALEHLQMVQALNNGDAAELRHLVCRHILRLGPLPRAEVLAGLCETAAATIPPTGANL